MKILPLLVLNLAFWASCGTPEAEQTSRSESEFVDAALQKLNNWNTMAGLPNYEDYQDSAYGLVVHGHLLGRYDMENGRHAAILGALFNHGAWQEALSLLEGQEEPQDDSLLIGLNAVKALAYRQLGDTARENHLYRTNLALMENGVPQRNSQLYWVFTMGNHIYRLEGEAGLKAYVQQVNLTPKDAQALRMEGEYQAELAYWIIREANDLDDYYK